MQKVPAKCVNVGNSIYTWFQLSFVKVPFKKSVFTHICNAFRRLFLASKSYLNEWGILKSQKLLAELTIKEHISNQQQTLKWTCCWMLFLMLIVLKKNLLFRIDQLPACAVISASLRLQWETELLTAVAVTIRDWLFHLKGGAYCAWQFLLFISNRSKQSLVSC